MKKTQRLYTITSTVTETRQYVGQFLAENEDHAWSLFDDRQNNSSRGSDSKLLNVESETTIEPAVEINEK